MIGTIFLLLSNARKVGKLEPIGMRCNLGRRSASTTRAATEQKHTQQNEKARADILEPKSAFFKTDLGITKPHN